MNDDHDEHSPASHPKNSSPPPVFEHLPYTPIPQVSPLKYWLRALFVCNPFYLASAALLLYGLYLISADTNLLQREIFQLTFNFSSLQLYETLLVATAIMLARRKIWYDSLLLVGLENMLVLVPFILISQAALLDQPIVTIICLTGGVAAICRFYGLKKFLKELNLPGRVLGCGFVLLLINVALPLVFRHLHESKIGTKPTDGAAYELNRYSWLLLLPAMVALINLLPRPKPAGDLLPQRRWLPMGLFALWLIASGVHLYSLSYVYNFDWEPIFRVPLLWVAAWTLYICLQDYLKKPVVLLERILIVPPALVTLLALNAADKPIFLTLTIINLVAYAFILFKEHRNRTALVLLFASVQALIAVTWKPSSPAVPMFFRPEELVTLATSAFLLFWVARSRNYKVSLLGLIIIAITGAMLSRFRGTEYLTPHLALVFVMLHSFRWNNQGFDTQVFRGVMCAAWFGHALLLVHTDWLYSLPVVYFTGTLVLLTCVLIKMLTGSWRPFVVPITAGLVLLAQPGDFLVHKTLLLPVGLVAVVGSFILFGLGTLAALTKSKWNHSGTQALSSVNKPNTLIL